MKKVYLFFVFICFTLVGYAQGNLEFLMSEKLSFKQKVALAEAYFFVKGTAKHSGYKQYLRWKYFAQRNLDNNGFVLSERQMIEAQNAFIQNNPTLQNATSWTELGPLEATNTSTWSSHIGRITNIGIDPNDSNHIILSSPGGGLWKTTDEGITWTPIFDTESTMNLYSCNISSSNSQHYLAGIYGSVMKSTDGGTSWSSTSGINGNGVISTIIQDPTNSNVFLAAGTYEGKIYRSTDSGSTWTPITVSTNTLYDIEFKTNDSQIVYTCGRNGKMFESTDNGLTWNAVSGPWNNSGSLMMAVTNNDPNYIYVLQESSGGFGGLYLSTDGGATFSTQSNDAAGNNNIMGYDKTQIGGQAPRDMDVIVSPTDKTEVHVAGIMTFKSNDSGVNWTQTTHWVVYNPLPFVHADIDQMIYKNGKIYVASDGGFFISTDAANSFIDRTTGLGIRQFYRISASPEEANKVAGGSQDNGTGILSSNIWYDFIGADGMEPIIFNHNKDHIIGSIQFGYLYKSTNGGQTIFGLPTVENMRGDWVTPLERDPVLKNVAYQGKKHIHRSDDGGNSWTQLASLPWVGTDTICSEIYVAPSDNKVIYTSYRQHLFKSIDGGNSWSQLLASNTNFINYIFVDEDDANHAIIALNGVPRVRETTDGGINWTDITGNLPSLTVQSAIFNTNGDIYASTYKGVYHKPKNSSTWSLVGTNLPNVNVTELEIIGSTLYAATYGRGLWSYNIGGQNCVLRPNISVGVCVPQNNSFSLVLEPKGIGLGATYSVTGDVQQSNISYANPGVLNNEGYGFPTTDGPITITVTDDTNANCSASFEIGPNTTNCTPNLHCHFSKTIFFPGTYYAEAPNAGNGAEDPTATHASWYVYKPVVNGQVTVKSCGAAVNTKLNIYSGSCGNFTLLASSDDDCGTASLVSQLNVSSDATYYIEWTNTHSSNGFDFELLFEEKEDCANALVVYPENITGLNLKSSGNIYLEGVINNNVTTYTNGDVLILNALTNSANLVLNPDQCSGDSIVNWKVIGGGNVPIIANGETVINFTIPSNIQYSISDLDVLLDITFNAVSKLDIKLQAPNNSLFTLWDNYCTNDANLNFILDENGNQSDLCTPNWDYGNRMYKPGLVPLQSLSALNGTMPAGNWSIKIINSSSTTGTVNKVALDFEG